MDPHSRLSTRALNATSGYFSNLSCIRDSKERVDYGVQPLDGADEQINSINSRDNLLDRELPLTMHAPPPTWLSRAALCG